MNWFRDIGAAHERLKKQIHGTRIPLSKNGIRIMKVVYFTTPIVAGYYVMQWAQTQAQKNLAIDNDEIRSAGGATTQQQVARQNDQLKDILKGIEK